jgi:hypothetical protein
MRKAGFIAVIVTFVALGATSGVSKRRASVAPPKDDLTITFSRTLVDAGTIAHKASPDWRFTRTNEDIGVRVDSRSAASRRAILRASLPNVDASYVVRIDGITLRSLPVVIDSRAEIGAMTPHRIEIEVPASTPEGALITSIVWEAETP